MTFQKVKPTKPALDQLKKKKSFSLRGESLLEIKHEQNLNALKKVIDNYFQIRTIMRAKLIESLSLLEQSYESNGKQKLNQVSMLHASTLKTSINITYIHESGIDVPKIELIFNERKLPSYSCSDVSLHVDILMKKLKETVKILVELAELDSLMHKLANNHKTIQHRIDALNDIIIPKLSRNIRSIQEILIDGEREEFIRLKKIKDFLGIEKN